MSKLGFFENKQGTVTNNARTVQSQPECIRHEPGDRLPLPWAFRPRAHAVPQPPHQSTPLPVLGQEASPAEGKGESEPWRLPPTLSEGP